MSKYLPSLFGKKIVNHFVWHQLAQLWLTMAIKDETSMITEDLLFKLQKILSSSHVRQQLKLDQFLGAAASQLAAFFRQQQEKLAEIDLVRLTLMRKMTINDLTSLVIFGESHQTITNRS